MYSRFLAAKRPHVFPGLSAAESASVWERAEARDLLADPESELTEGERAAIVQVLGEAPRLTTLAQAYLALVEYSIRHPVLAVLAVVLVPAALIRIVLRAFGFGA
jgi:hypothetical protein